jgi:hypothetical protein
VRNNKTEIYVNDFDIDFTENENGLLIAELLVKNDDGLFTSIGAIRGLGLGKFDAIENLKLEIERKLNWLVDDYV